MLQIIKRLIAFVRLDSYLSRRRSRLAREIIEIALPSRPQVARHQRSAALHIQLAQEIGWSGPSGWRGR